MALTVAKLALALRVIADEGDSLTSGQEAVLDRILGAANAILTAYLNGATISASDIEDEACIRLASYLYDVAGGDRGARNPVVASGAAALLDPFRTRRVQAVEEDEDDDA